jgi:lysophospholipase
MSAAPGPIEPTFTGDVVGLYFERFDPKDKPLGVVVITHGYAEHCGRYRELAHVIVRAGWTALSYDVRGHGRSPGARGYIDRFTTYLNDLDKVCRTARSFVPAPAPLVLLGHSNGGLITLRALCSERPLPCRQAIVSSPLLGLRLAVPRYKKLLARIGSVVAPKFAQPNQLRVEQLTSDRAKQAERSADTLCFDIATARWFTEADAAQNYVATHASRIAAPTLWLVGGDDPIADPASAKRVAHDVAKADYHDLVGLRHEVFNETTRADVFAHVTRALTSG